MPGERRLVRDGFPGAAHLLQERGDKRRHVHRPAADLDLEPQREPVGALERLARFGARLDRQRRLFRARAVGPFRRLDDVPTLGAQARHDAEGEVDRGLEVGRFLRFRIEFSVGEDEIALRHGRARPVELEVADLHGARLDQPPGAGLLPAPIPPDRHDLAVDDHARLGIVRADLLPVIDVAQDERRQLHRIGPVALPHACSFGAEDEPDETAGRDLPGSPHPAGGRQGQAGEPVRQGFGDRLHLVRSDLGGYVDEPERVVGQGNLHRTDQSLLPVDPERGAGQPAHIERPAVGILEAQPLAAPLRQAPGEPGLDTRIGPGQHRLRRIGMQEPAGLAEPAQQREGVLPPRPKKVGQTRAVVGLPDPRLRKPGQEFQVRRPDEARGGAAAQRIEDVVAPDAIVERGSRGVEARLAEVDFQLRAVRRQHEDQTLLHLGRIGIGRRRGRRGRGLRTLPDLREPAEHRPGERRCLPLATGDRDEDRRDVLAVEADGARAVAREGVIPEADRLPVAVPSPVRNQAADRAVLVRRNGEDETALRVLFPPDQGGVIEVVAEPNLHDVQLPLPPTNGRLPPGRRTRTPPPPIHAPSGGEVKGSGRIGSTRPQGAAGSGDRSPPPCSASTGSTEERTVRPTLRRRMPSLRTSRRRAPGPSPGAVKAGFR